MVRDTELESAISDLKDVDLVVTDSKVFKYVDKVISRDMKLTSFSIIMANQKGDLKEFAKGITRLKCLDQIDRPRYSLWRAVATTSPMKILAGSRYLD